MFAFPSETSEIIITPKLGVRKIGGVPNYRLERRVYPSPNSPGSLNESDFNRYEYDANGNVTFEKKRNNQTVSYTFDKNNRLTFKNLSDNTYSGDIAYNYNLRGLTLASCFGADQFADVCTSSGEGETNVFDGFGNLTSRTSRMGGTSRFLTFQYDKEGNRTRITHPDNWFFQYGFDGLNRVNELRESASATPTAGTNSMLTITYRPSGGRLDVIRANGAVTNLDPDNALRLETFTQNFSGSANDLTNLFFYNPASQVTKLTQSNALYTFNQLASRTGTYQANGLNQISSIAGQTLSYDSAGNLTNDAAGMTYTYDMENRLVATGGAKSSTLVYDVLGRLSRITVDGITTHFQYDGDALVDEYVGITLTRRYVHGDQVDEPLVQYNGVSVGASFRRYLHADHEGSIVAHSDSAAAVPVLNKYDPYGIPATANDGRFGFTGQTWLKQIGLNYYKARMYSPKLGKFLQTDPIFYADDMNMYVYARNDPMNLLDPTGRNPEAIPVIVVVGVVIVSTCAASSFCGEALGESARMVLQEFGRQIESFRKPRDTTVGVVPETYIDSTSTETSDADSADELIDDVMLAKGGKQNVRDSGLAGVPDSEIIKGARDKSLTSKERKRYQKEEKARGLRHSGQSK